MKNKLIFNLLTVLLVLGSISCVQKENKIKEATIPAELSQEAATTVKTTHCFINEYPYTDESGMKDVEELRYSLEGTKVTGYYNWLPAEKDQRKGSFQGILSDSMIVADYTFTQEGANFSTKLKIILSETEAVVTTYGANQGLDAVITKVNCPR